VCYYYYWHAWLCHRFLFFISCVFSLVFNKTKSCVSEREKKNIQPFSPFLFESLEILFLPREREQPNKQKRHECMLFSFYDFKYCQVDEIFFSIYYIFNRILSKNKLNHVAKHNIKREATLAPWCLHQLHSHVVRRQ
jgi:hypothetical protein